MQYQVLVMDITQVINQSTDYCNIVVCVEREVVLFFFFYHSLYSYRLDYLRSSTTDNPL